MIVWRKKIIGLSDYQAIRLSELFLVDYSYITIYSGRSIIEITTIYTCIMNINLCLLTISLQQNCGSTAKSVNKQRTVLASDRRSDSKRLNN